MYCADTLIGFYVSSFYEKNFFRRILEPLKRVERVIITGRFDNFDSETFVFEELFLALQKLDLFYVETADGWRYYPNLREFTCLMKTDDIHIGQEHVHALLENNSQISSLKVSGYTRSFLQNVAKTVPHLECVDIEDYDSDDHGAIHRF